MFVPSKNMQTQHRGSVSVSKSLVLGSSLSTLLRQCITSTRGQVVVGSNPAGSWAIFSVHLFNNAVSQKVSQRVAIQLILLENMDVTLFSIGQNNLYTPINREITVP